MKAMGIATLPQVADLHPVNAFAQSRRAATAAPRPSFLQRLLTWHRVANERRRLLELDERTLRDVGLTPDDAVREASRPFWDHDRRS